MSVNSINVTSGPYQGNGVNATFPYTFKIFEKDQLVVFEKTATGVVTKLTEGTHYTVAGVGDSSGNVTRVAGALPTGSTWLIRANYTPLQKTAFRSQGAFFPVLHEDAIDKLTVLVQQLEEVLGRTIKLDVWDLETADLTLPSIQDRAGKFLGFDQDGNIEIVVGKQYIDDLHATQQSYIDQQDQYYDQLSQTRDQQLQTIIDLREAESLTRDGGLQTIIDLREAESLTRDVSLGNKINIREVESINRDSALQNSLSMLGEYVSGTYVPRFVNTDFVTVIFPWDLGGLIITGSTFFIENIPLIRVDLSYGNSVTDLGTL